MRFRFHPRPRSARPSVCSQALVCGILIIGGDNLVVRNDAYSNATQTVSFNIAVGNTKGEILINSGLGLTLTASPWADIVP